MIVKGTGINELVALASQELGFTPKKEDFMNPYKKTDAVN
jgi:hypothetical protein